MTPLRDLALSGGMSRTELDVPGVPETTLSAELLAGLPGNRAPAPWECVSSALVWMDRGGRAASKALPPNLSSSSGLGVIGGMVRYLDTPVGTYDEVFGAVAVRSGRSVQGNVAFMAVDSQVSIVGGRTNWAMPKTLARFGGSIEPNSTMTAEGAGGVQWRVTAKPKFVGPSVPLKSSAVAVQQFPDGSVGRSQLRLSGRMRPALVSVGVESDGPLAQWLRPGLRLGALVEHMTFSLDEPRTARS